MNNHASRKKIILIVGIATTLLLLVIIIFSLGKAKSHEYEVLVAPVDSTFTIDGKPAQAGKIKLTEGRHTLKATRELFEDAVVEVDTKDLYPGQSILVLPEAVSAEAKQWLEDHPDTTGVADRVGAITVAQKNQAIAEKYPIVNNLPYTSIDFRIDYGVDDALNISFTITLYPYAKPGNQSAMQKQLKEFKAEALQYLSDNGIKGPVPIKYVPAEATDL